MNYIWDNIDKHLNKEQIQAFLKLDGIDLDTPNLLDKLKKRKISYNSLNIIDKNSHILDIGCGLGEDCLELADLTGSKGKVFGVDISGNLTKEATRISMTHKFNNIFYQTMDAHKLEYPDEAYDIVCIRRSLQHMVNPQIVINEALRVLRSKGKIIIIEPDRGSAIINHPDRQLTRRVMTYIEEVVRNPWIGRQLQQLLKNAVTSLSIKLNIDSLTNYNSINNNLGIEKATTQLVNMKIISKEEATNWLSVLQELNRNNQLFLLTTQFIATGVK